MDIASFIALGNIKEAEAVLFAAEESGTVISAVTETKTVKPLLQGHRQLLKTPLIVNKRFKS
jgi:hypothetical protein